MAGNSKETSIKWVVTVAFLILIAYQVYNGISLRKLGVPGILEVEFGDPVVREDSLEDILGRE